MVAGDSKRPVVILVHGTDVGAWPKRVRAHWSFRLLLFALAGAFGVVAWTMLDGERWGRSVLAAISALLLVYLSVSKKVAMPNGHDWIHLGENVDHTCRPKVAGGRSQRASAATDVLRNELDQLEPAPMFLAFAWSGLNSTSHRLQAAHCLSEELKQRLSKTPGPVFIVAHSHGGNVALYARDCLVEPDRDRVHVIALSTPFIRVFRSKIREFFLALVLFTFGLTLLVLRSADTQTLRVAAVAFAVMAAVWIAVSWLGWLMYASAPYFRSSDRKDRSAATKALIALVFGGALVFLAVQLLTSAGDELPFQGPIEADVAWSAIGAATLALLSAKTVERMRGRRAWAKQDHIQCRPGSDPADSAIERIGRRLDVAAVQPDTTVVIRTVGDEAEGFLVTSQFVAWSAGRKLVDLVTPDDVSADAPDKKTLFWSAAKWGSFLASALVLAAIYSAFLPDGAKWWEAPVFAIVVLGTIRLLGATVLWVTTGLAFGWTHAPLIWFFGTSAEALPYGEPTVHQLAVSSTTDPNMHSSWKNPRAAELVRQAIEQRL